MTRLTTLVVLLLFLSITVHGQEQETLFGTDIDHGGYGALSTRLTSVQGTDAAIVGAYGGWLIDHTLMLGLGGFGLTTDVRTRPAAQERYNPNGEPLYVQFGYGGFMLEYIIAPNDLLHITLQALAGGGTVSYREHWTNDNDYRRDDSQRYGGHDALFVIEPAAHAEVNVTEWFRISAGASYRYVSGIDELRGVDNDDFRGLAGNLTFKFGAF